MESQNPQIPGMHRTRAPRPFRAPSAIQYPRRRRAFTLTELLMAAACTTGIVTAGSTMAVAVSYALSSASQNLAAVVSGHGAAQRAARLVRQSRLIGYYSSTQLVLWTSDANTDDQTQLSETGLLWYDSTSSQLKWTTAFSTGMTPAQIVAADRVVSFTELATSAFATAIQTSSNAQTTLLADNVTAFSITGNAASTTDGLIDMRLTINGGQGVPTFLITASPRAPADYLLSTTTRTNDNISTKRYRRLAQKSWTVPP